MNPYNSTYFGNTPTYVKTYILVPTRYTYTNIRKLIGRPNGNGLQDKGKGCYVCI